MFSFLKDKLQNNGIAFLQETHSTSFCEEEWKSDWGGELLFSNGSSNSRGVIIGFTKGFDVTFEQTTQDKNGRILISDVTVDSLKYTLINLYNANSEHDQINTLNSFNDHIQKHANDCDRFPIFMGDLNFIFDTQLDALGGNPSLKKRSIASFIKIQERLDVSDIFRIRFPHTKRFTFRQKSKTETVHRRLDYIFLSNALQEYAQKVEILPSFLSDHSPVLLSLGHSKENNRGKGLWKFNNSHLQDGKFETGLVDVIKKTIHDLSDTSFSPHLVWEIIKYEIRKFCIKYSKLKSIEKKVEKSRHESVIQNFENNIHTQTISHKQYTDSKLWIENWYDDYVNGIILRSKSDWYEKGEKSTKYFLNLERKKQYQKYH